MSITWNKNKNILKCSNYLINIIDQCIKKFFDKLCVPNQIILTLPKRELLVVLPFIETFSMNLRKGLYKLVRESLSQCNIKVIFQSKNWLSNLLNSRTPFPYIFAPTLFINFSVVIAIFLIMAKLNVILKLELLSIYIHFY